MTEAHQLFTEEQKSQLIHNWRYNGIMQDTANADPFPVVKWFTPDAQCTWLITELEESGDRAFGLCDLGMGEPELGYVSIAEITEGRGLLGLKIERDLSFKADAPLSVYAERAKEAGRIVA